jgi:hypothetical protein
VGLGFPKLALRAHLKPSGSNSNVRFICQCEERMYTCIWASWIYGAHQLRLAPSRSRNWRSLGLQRWDCLHITRRYRAELIRPSALSPRDQTQLHLPAKHTRGIMIMLMILTSNCNNPPQKVEDRFELCIVVRCSFNHQVSRRDSTLG